MSRARLGLYVFCRKDLFKDCYELTQTFSKLLQRPDKLQLVKGEQFNNCVRQVDQAADQNNVFQVEDVIHMGQIVTPAQAIAPPPQALVVADEAEVVGDLPEENFPTHPDTEMKDE
jgi:intron-binding protein aquarius